MRSNRFFHSGLQLLPPALLAASALSCVATEQAQAQAQTQAGIRVTNVAEARANVAGSTVAAASNPVSFVVAERLDVTLTRTDPRTATALPALLVNRGNGTEAFTLAAAGPGGVTIRGIAIDADGDGAYDPAHDVLLSGTTPVLDPGASLALLVLVDGAPASDAAGAVALEARAVTGSGTPGTTFTGLGDGGGDAVVGPTTAMARVSLPFGGGAPVAPTLVKSQSVRAPDGSEQPVAGAVVSYAIQATFTDTRRAARIDDPIPAGTRYVAGSLTLDGATLTDAAGDDAGTADGAGITVTLGDIAAGPGTAAITRTVRFQVVLQ